MRSEEVNRGARHAVLAIYTSYYLLYGLLLLLPWQTFEPNRNVYSTLAAIAPEEAWGAWFVLLGLFGLWEVSQRIRGEKRRATPTAFLMWLLGTGTMIFLAVTPFLTGIQRGVMPAAATSFAVLAVAFIWCAIDAPATFRAKRSPERRGSGGAIQST